MLEFHHNAASSCSQKVRLVLAEKGLDFVSHEVDLIGGGQHDPAYVKLNPNHVVPTLVDDGRVLIESTLINEYLDEAYPDPPLRPAAPADRHALRLWTQRIDTLHPSAGVLTYAIGPRRLLMQQPEAARAAHIAAIPDPAARERRRSVIEHGVAAPEFRGALAAFLATLDAMQDTLGERDWLSGEAFGLADAAALPYVLRMEHLAMGPLVAERGRVLDWLTRVKDRPSFDKAVAQWLPQAIVDLFRQGGEAVWPEVQAAAAKR